MIKERFQVYRPKLSLVLMTALFALFFFSLIPLSLLHFRIFAPLGKGNLFIIILFSSFGSLAGMLMLWVLFAFFRTIKIGQEAIILGWKSYSLDKTVFGFLDNSRGNVFTALRALNPDDTAARKIDSCYIIARGESGRSRKYRFSAKSHKQFSKLFEQLKGMLPQDHSP